MRKTIRLLLINLAILLPGIVMLELAFGGWFDNGDPLLNFARPRNVTWSFSVPWQREGALYRRDRYGLRGLDGSVADISILTVGGSTTDQRYLADADTWQEALQRAFNAKGENLDVVNAGIDGQSTIGHIKNFPQWFDKIDGFHADYILFYIGINDFYIAGDNVFDSDLVKKNRWKDILNKSALIAAGKIFRDIFRAKKSDARVDQKPGHSFGGIDSSPYSNTRKLPQCCDDPYLVDAMAGLRQRVETLAELTRQRGAQAIFVTQRSALWFQKDDTVFGMPGLTYAHPSVLKNLGEITGVDRHDIEVFQAQTILSACRQAGAICVDLTNEIRFDIERDFYDSIHNTPAGAEKIGRYLFDTLKDPVGAGKRTKG